MVESGFKSTLTDSAIKAGQKVGEQAREVVKEGVRQVGSGIARFAAAKFEEIKQRYSPEARMAANSEQITDTNKAINARKEALQIASGHVESLKEQKADPAKISEYQVQEATNYRVMKAHERHRAELAARYLDDLNTKHGPQLDLLESKEKEIEESEKNAALYEKFAATVESKIKELQSETAALPNDGEAYYAKIEEANARIAEMTDAMKDFRSQAEALRGEASKNRQTITRLQEKYGPLLKKRTEMRGYLPQAAEEVVASKEKVAQKTETPKESVQPIRPASDALNVVSSPQVAEGANDNAPSELANAIRAVIEQAQKPSFDEALKGVDTIGQVGATDFVQLWNTVLRDQGVRVLQESDMPNNAKMTLPEYGMYLFNQLQLSKDDVEKGMQRIGDALRDAQTEQKEAAA